jgi:hypothetical protein
MGPQDLRREIDEVELEPFVERHPHPFLLGDNSTTKSTQRLTPPTDGIFLRTDAEEEESIMIHEVVRSDRSAGEVLVGTGEDVDVRIRGLAANHAVFVKLAAGWAIGCLASSEDALAVRGTIIEHGARVDLKSGDTIAFADGDLRYVFLDARDLHARLRRRAAPPAPPPAEGDLVARCEPIVPVVLAKDREVKIGRAPECDLVLPHSSVSRVHASLVRRGDAVFVRDLGSVNGTLVGTRRVHGELEVKPGGQPVVVGVYRIQITRADDSPEAGHATAAFKREDLRCSLEALPLADFVQGVERNQLTGMVRIETADGGLGIISFEQGAPHAASFGDAHGVEAVFQLLRVRSGTLLLVRNAEREGPVEIRGTFTGLLLEASRLEDEEDRSRLSGRVSAATQAVKGIYSSIGMAKYVSPEHFLLSLEKGAPIDPADPAIARLREYLPLLCKKGVKGSEGKIVRTLVIAAYACRAENSLIGAFEIVRSLGMAVRDRDDGSIDLVKVIEALLASILKYLPSAGDLEGLARAAINLA